MSGEERSNEAEFRAFKVLPSKPREGGSSRSESKAVVRDVKTSWDLRWTVLLPAEFCSMKSDELPCLL